MRDWPTAKSAMSIISCTSPSPSALILPVSSVTRLPSALLCARSSSPIRRTISPRFGAGTMRHCSNTLRADDNDAFVVGCGCTAHAAEQFAGRGIDRFDDRAGRVFRPAAVLRPGAGVELGESKRARMSAWKPRKNLGSRASARQRCLTRMQGALVAGLTADHDVRGNFLAAPSQRNACRSGSAARPCSRKSSWRTKPA